jgi:hypothetical protein
MTRSNFQIAEQAARAVKQIAYMAFRKKKSDREPRQ